MRAAAVLDSLVAAGEIGPTVAVFVQPGTPEGITAADQVLGCRPMVTPYVPVRGRRKIEPGFYFLYTRYI